MKYTKLMGLLFFMFPVATLASYTKSEKTAAFKKAAPSKETDMQKYWSDMEAEIAKYITAIKKAGNDTVKITAASKAHEKAVMAIRKKHRAGLDQYYKTVYQDNDAQRKEFTEGLAKLKKEYEPKLGTYWKEFRENMTNYNSEQKALRSKYSAPLKEYDKAMSEMEKNIFK